MRWTIRISDQALKTLKKLDRVNREMILSFLEQRIDGCESPRLYGKPLRENLGGLWRYRVGQYRVLCEIEETTVTVYVIAIGHRREVYRGKE